MKKAEIFNKFLHEAVNFPISTHQADRYIFFIELKLCSRLKYSERPVHSHPHHEIIIVQSGEINYKVANISHCCKNGDIFVIPPYVPHSFFVETETELLGVALLIKYQGSSSPDTKTLSGKMPFFADQAQDAAKKVLEIISDIFSEITKKHTAWSMVTEYYVQVFTVMLLRILDSHAGWTPTLEILGNKYLVRAMNLLMKNICSEVKINSIARQLGITERHLSRIFNDFLGTTPKQFIQENRLYYIYADLVFNPGISIKEIAYKYKIYDTRYFAKLIKQTFGKTPTEIQNFKFMK
ncbi:MAG TPA: hypothetical protein DC049_15370 [Spirochaetia bacterium]|nr:hypothetical protein [Spirochaetia bacterium]